MILHIILGVVGFLVVYTIVETIHVSKKKNAKEEALYREAYESELAAQKQMFADELASIEDEKAQLAKTEAELKEQQGILNYFSDKIKYNEHVPHYYQDEQTLDSVLALMISGNAESINEALRIIERDKIENLRAMLAERRERAKYLTEHMDEEVDLKMVKVRLDGMVRSINRDYERGLIEQRISDNKNTVVELRQEIKRLKEIKIGYEEEDGDDK